MINYFIAKTKWTGKNYAIIEHNYVGYLVHIIKNNGFKKDEFQRVYIYEYYARENTFDHYAFLSWQEKQLFSDLISVSSIGPVKALKILRQINSPDEFKAAVSSNNTEYFNNIKGIGVREINQIFFTLEKFYLNLKNHNNKSEINQEVVRGLITIGYKKDDIIKAMNSFDNKNLEVEEIMAGVIKIISENQLKTRDDN